GCRRAALRRSAPRRAIVKRDRRRLKLSLRYDAPYSVLLQEREQLIKRSETLAVRSVRRTRIVPPAAGIVGNIGIGDVASGREYAVSADRVVQGDAHLPQLMGARGPSSCLAGRLHGWQQQSHQYADDGDHH